MKKITLIMMAVLILSIFAAGCGTTTDTGSTETTPQATKNTSTETKNDVIPDTPITVVSREEGSGTRGAFIELLGIEQKDADGKNVDYTTVDAEIASGTSVVMTSVANNPNAIGYISLGSVNDTVKTIFVDGVEPTVENVKNGTYALARPFNLAIKEDSISEAAQTFIDYILSADGQEIVEASGYISSGNSGPFAGSSIKGKVVVSGSTSVAPLMEKLAEAYKKVNPNAEIEVHHLGSTAGMTNAIEGVCDIGMASREVKASEIEAGLTPIVMALDGIAVIVNKNSVISRLTSDQIRAIYMGEITRWSEING